MTSVKEAFEGFPDSEEVQKHGGALVQNLTQVEERYRQEAHSLGVATAILTVLKTKMQAHNSGEKVSELAIESLLAALRNITLSETTRTDLCTKENIEALIEVGSTHAEFPMIFANIMSIVRILVNEIFV